MTRSQVTAVLHRTYKHIHVLLSEKVNSTMARWSVQSAKNDHVSHTEQRLRIQVGACSRFRLAASDFDFFDTSPNLDKMVSTLLSSRQGATDCTYGINNDDDDLRLATLALDASNALTRFGCG
jgi:hypothetical protein